MTVEKRTTIEPGDIITVEVKCSVCESRVTRRIEDYRNEPTGCANCGASWTYLAQEWRRLSQFVNMLRLFAAAQTAKDSPYTLRFGLAESWKDLS